MEDIKTTLEKRIARSTERERLKRIGYQQSCRKIIAYQIDNWKQKNGYKKGFHLDHVIPFALIVDIFREKIMQYNSQTKLPVSIGELSGVGKKFAIFHSEVSVYEYIPASENLEKAASQTRKNNYGLTENLLLAYKTNLNCKFDILFGLPPEVPVKTDLTNVPREKLHYFMQ